MAIKLKMIKNKDFVCSDLDFPFCTSRNEIGRPVILRDRAFRDVVAQKILSDIDQLNKDLKTDSPSQLPSKVQSSFKITQKVDPPSTVSNLSTKRTDLDRVTEKLIRQSWRMNLAASNSTFRFGCNDCAALWARPGYTFIPGHALSRRLPDQIQSESDEKRLQSFVESWTKKTNEKFTLNSRAVSVINYEYNPRMLRESLKALLESLGRKENQDLACINPSKLCQKVVQAALDTCRLKSSLKMTTKKSKFLEPKQPSAAWPRSSSPAAFVPHKEERSEPHKYLNVMGGMPEGILSRYSPSTGSWEAANYRVDENGTLLRNLPDDVGSRASLVCSLPADLCSVRLSDSAPGFGFDLLLEDDVLNFATESEEDRDRWVTCARLFVNVPDILNIVDHHFKQEQRHRLARRAEKMLVRKAAKAPLAEAFVSKPISVPTVAAGKETVRLLPRPSSAVPPSSVQVSGSGAAAQRPLPVRPASAAK